MFLTPTSVESHQFVLSLIMVFKNLILIFNAYRIYKTDKKGVARYLNFSMMIEGSVLFIAFFLCLCMLYWCLVTFLDSVLFTAFFLCLCMLYWCLVTICRDSDPMINTARPASSANPSLKTPNRPYSVKLTQQRGTRSGLIRLAPIDRSKTQTPNVVISLPCYMAIFSILFTISTMCGFSCIPNFSFVQLIRETKHRVSSILSSHFLHYFGKGTFFSRYIVLWYYLVHIETGI